MSLAFKYGETFCCQKSSNYTPLFILFCERLSRFGEKEKVRGDLDVGISLRGVQNPSHSRVTITHLHLSQNVNVLK